MKSSRFISMVLIVAMFIVVAGVNTAFCQDQTYSLLVQQTPANAGTVMPGTGIHKMGVSNAVDLVAIPKPGYRFVHWMGDVSDMTANKTLVMIDSPKIVVAVFEKTENGLLSEAAGVGNTSKSGGGTGGGGSSPHTPGIAGSLGYLTPTPPPIAYSHAASPAPEEVSYSRPNPKSLVVVPPAVPEPGTLLLLGGGVMFLVRKRK